MAASIAGNQDDGGNSSGIDEDDYYVDYDKADIKERARAGHQKTAVDSLINLFLNRNTDEFADIKFSFKFGAYTDHRTMLAHRIVLSRSPVFDEIFRGSTRVNNDEPIVIENIRYEVFNELLRFLYYDNLRLDEDNVADVLKAVKKYQVSAARCKCIRFLERRINAEEACNIFEQSIKLDERKLKSKCMKYIQENTMEILRERGFAKIEKSTLCEILKLEGLCAPEVKIFQGCLVWAKVQCVQDCDCFNYDDSNDCCRCTFAGGETAVRDAMTNVLPLVRFPTMSLVDFRNEVIPLGILNDSECNEILKYLTDNDLLKNNTTIFSCVTRFRYPEESFGLFGGFDLADLCLEIPVDAPSSESVKFRGYEVIEKGFIKFEAECEISTDVMIRGLYFNLGYDDSDIFNLMIQNKPYLENIDIVQGDMIYHIKQAHYRGCTTAVDAFGSKGNVMTTTSCPLYLSFKKAVSVDGVEYLDVKALVDPSKYVLRAGIFRIIYRVHSHAPIPPLLLPTFDAKSVYPNYRTLERQRVQKNVTCIIRGIKQPLVRLDIQKYEKYNAERTGGSGDVQGGSGDVLGSSDDVQGGSGDVLGSSDDVVGGSSDILGFSADDWSCSGDTLVSPVPKKRRMR